MRPIKVNSGSGWLLEREFQIHQITQDKIVLGPLQEDITPKTGDLPELPFSLDVEEDNLTEEQKKLLNAMLHRHVGASEEFGAARHNPEE